MRNKEGKTKIKKYWSTQERKRRERKARKQAEGRKDMREKVRKGNETSEE
jgi:hypothetical protein